MSPADRALKAKLERRHNVAAMPADIRRQIFTLARYFAFEIAVGNPSEAALARAYDHVARLARAVGRAAGAKGSVHWFDIVQARKERR